MMEGKDKFLTIKHAETENLVQVAYLVQSGNSERMYVLVSYPFEDRFRVILARAGIQVPEGWTMDLFEKGTCVQFAVPIEKKNDISGFVYDVFVKLFQVDPSRGLQAGVDAM